MKLIMISFGELNTKGKNKRDFTKRLREDLKNRLLNLVDKITLTHDKIYIDYDEINEDVVVNKIKMVPGIAYFSLVEQIPLDLSKIEEKTLESVKDKSGAYDIEVRRSNKRFPLNSLELEMHLGEIVKNHYPDLKISFKNSKYHLRIDIKESGAFFFNKTYDGLKGFPLGSQGKLLLMISGGIDSVVAGYQIISRGLTIECIHFASPPYTSSGVIEKIKVLLSKLTNFQPRIILHIIRFTEIQKKIYESEHGYHVTIMRRMMYRIANRLANNRGIHGVASGESIGQVASQTLESIDVISKVLDIVHFRPLAFFDKEKIISIAKTIDTFDTSILPYEDCCTIFPVKNPVTKPKLKEVLFYESKFDYEQLIDEAISNVETIVIKAE